MKKLLIALAGFCMGTLCFAQMMPDSTVQIVAYWDKGEMIVYDYKESRTQTVDGVTIDTKSATEKHVLEITDATEHSYTVKFSFEDVYNMPMLTGAANETAERITEHVWVETKTDEMGTVQEITNEEATFADFRATFPVMTDRVLSKYTAEELREEGVSRDDLIQKFINGLCTESFLQKICEKNVVPLLRYHGARFEMNKEYTVRQELVDVLGSGTVEVNWKFWIDSSECTEEFVLIHSYAEADKETLTPLLRDIMMAADITLTDDDVADIIAGMDATLEDYSSIAIHLASGWPVEWHNKRITTLEEDGSATVITEEREFEISEDDYRNQ